MECELGKAEWMCGRCCRDCEHSIGIKPADNVEIYQDGKLAKAVPVRVRLTRVKAIEEDGR